MMATEGKGRERPAAKRAKPAKPYADFPLFPHATGRWAKKIRGQFKFFGPWEDPQGALERYLAQRDDLHARRVPSLSAMAGLNGVRTASQPLRAPGPSAALSVRDLANHFMTAKQRRLTAGDMGRRSFSDYHTTCRYVVEALGRDKLVEELTAADFGGLRVSLSKGRGPVALGNQVNRVRSLFKFAFDSGLVERPVRFGPEFARPSMRLVRLARQSGPPKLFEPAEVHALLNAASPALRAMIYLGINCGLGNTDIAALSMNHLKGDVLDFPRPKTGIARRASLWPESIEAVQAYLRVRKKPAHKADKDIVFITKYGQRWVRVSEPGRRSLGQAKAVLSDGVGLQFRKLMVATGTQRPGRSFYALRHTFRTVADEIGDRRAIDLVMGHEPSGDISTHYVERVGIERLIKVAEHVRAWLGALPEKRC